jgi:FkbM family methyltransferase
MKNLIKKILKTFGVLVKRYPDLDLSRRYKLVNYHSIDIILDIGANSGQFGLQMRDIGYTDTIISFEPLKTAYNELIRKSPGDKKWFKYNFALGNEEGMALINISKNSYSSSLLQILPLHLNGDPDSEYIGQEEIEIRKLDSVFKSVCLGKKHIMVKIDTQGYEMKVLEGSASSLPFITLLQIEMSLVQLYEGEILYNRMFEFLQSKGFELWSVENGFYDMKTGRLLQFDCIFYNTNAEEILV